MTLSSRSVIDCLPLLAGVLGQAQGLKVEVGGSTAATNGKVITLPDLPMDGSPEFIALVRGYIDHEAAHIRHTDFDVLQQTKITALEQRLTNIFEDWRVEERQSDLFPGCRQNLHDLIRKQFMTPPAADTDSFLILNWLLLTVRGWVIPDLLPLAAEQAAVMDQLWPDLREKLEAILHQVQSHCPDTQASLTYARQMAQVLRRTFNRMRKTPDADSDATTRLKSLLSGSTDDLPEDIGTCLKRQITTQAGQSTGCGLATVGHKTTMPLSPTQRHAVQTMVVGLKARLHGLLQSSRQERIIRSRRGRLDSKRLAFAATGEPRLCQRSGNKTAVNTAVHLLLDSSGSMRGEIDLAVQCCAAVAQALTVRGLSVGVTVFPADPTVEFRATVAPLIKHGEPVREMPSLIAQGTTPLAEAVLWCLQTIAPLPQTRKIILIITDGEPDSHDRSCQAIQVGRALGVEFYGLGVGDTSIDTLLPECSRSLAAFHDLPAALFGMLEQALLGRKGDPS